MKKIFFFFSLVIYIVGLTSCNNEQPEIVPEVTKCEAIDPIHRTSEDAIQIAQEAFSNFYGVNPTSNTRVVSAKTNLLPNKLDTRSFEYADSLLYVVELGETEGFALVAAKKNHSPLLGISNQGNFDELMQTVPAFEFWINSTLEALSSYDSEETNSRGDISMPTGDGLLMSKEWNDTTYRFIKSPMVRNSWKQGSKENKSITSNPEGYYFSNGLCGCGPLAIAEVGLALGRPAYIYMDGPNKGERLELDWVTMRQHRAWKSDNSETVLTCINGDRKTYHEPIAKLCRAIGNYCYATETEDGTAVTAENLHNATSCLFGSNNITGYKTYTNTSHPTDNSIFIVIGTSKYDETIGHVWICDGYKVFTYYHYFATRNNANEDWVIQTAELQRDEFNHFNWGWQGKGNGWFASVEPYVSFKSGVTTEQHWYKNLKYITIK